MIMPTSNVKDYDKAAKIFKNGDPVFLVENGKADAVLLSAEEYERMQLGELLEGAANDWVNGRTYTHEEVFAELDAKCKKLLNQTENK